MDDSLDLRSACALAQLAVDKACGVIRQAAYASQSAITKDFDEVATATDIEAERAIRRVISEHSPIPILGEEEGLGSAGYSLLRWVADPIDGTTNFMRGIPLHVVSIALVEGSEAKVGVIAQPSTGLVVSGFRGGGITVAGSHDERRKYLFGKPLVVVEHGYKPEHQSRITQLMGTLCWNYELRLFGATALGLAYLASGKCDGVISCGDKLWDFAAGTCVVREMGGIVTDWKGVSWEDGNHDYYLAGTPEVHRSLVDIARGLQQ